MRRLLFLAAILFTAGRLSAQSDFVAIDFGGHFYTINRSTGSGSQVADSGVLGLNALATDNSGRLFAAGGGELFPVPDLLMLDSATGSVLGRTRLNFGSQLISIRGLAFSPAGILYAINNGGFGIDQDSLYTINLNTGNATLVGNTGLAGIQALDFSPQGILYGWDVGSTGTGRGLVTIDPVTGFATDVDPLVDGSASSIQSIVFAPDGNLYGARDALYKIDVASGALTLIGSGGYSDIRGLELVPEPSTAAIAISMACLAVLYFNRQKNTFLR